MASADSVVDFQSVFSSDNFINELREKFLPSVKDIIERHNKQQREYKGCFFVILENSIYLYIL